MQDDLLKMGSGGPQGPAGNEQSRKKQSHGSEHSSSHGKKLGDIPGNQTPNTPNKKESKRER